MTRRHYDLGVIGSGFAGSLISMVARRIGLSVVLIDKGKHPRIVIGESSTPLTNLLLEELADRYDLPFLKPLTKWGSWQQTYPELACGLKRGFTFYRHDWDSPVQGWPDRSNQLLVAASPNDQVADTHWYRADFDTFLVKEAQRLGVDYLDETHLATPQRLPDGFRLHGKHGIEPVSLDVSFVLDASGPRGFLHRAFNLAERPLDGLPQTQALYRHFSGVRSLDCLESGPSDDLPPYPVDDAAVHHIFDGGWVWVLRFNNGVTSAGLAATDQLAAQVSLASGESAWHTVLERMPLLRAQFARATAITPFTHLSSLSFRTTKTVDHYWAMLPSAAGFVDPLLSTGFPLTLLGIQRLGLIFERDWGANSFSSSLEDYARQTEAELLATATLVAALYANLSNFPVFSAVALVYFTAASYSETVKRLGKPQLARSFLLQDDAEFEAVGALLRRAQEPLTAESSARLVSDIHKSIEPWNIGNFGNPVLRNWHPMLTADLYASASKLQASSRDIDALLERCGLA